MNIVPDIRGEVNVRSTIDKRNQRSRVDVVDLIRTSTLVKLAHRPIIHAGHNLVLVKARH